MYIHVCTCMYMYIHVYIVYVSILGVDGMCEQVQYMCRDGLHAGIYVYNYYGDCREGSNNENMYKYIHTYIACLYIILYIL